MRGNHIWNILPQVSNFLYRPKFQRRFPANILCFPILSIPILFFSALLLLNSCQSVSDNMEIRAQLAQGEHQIFHKEYDEAIATYKEISINTGDSQLKAEALLGMGLAQMHLKHYHLALELLLEAKNFARDTFTKIASDRALGDVYFQQENYLLAYQHLEVIVDKVSLVEKNRLLVQLGISAYKIHKPSRGKVFLSRTDRHMEPELKELLRKHLPNNKYGRERVYTQRTPPPSDKSPVTGFIRVLPRERWNATSIHSNRELLRRAYRITVHHTGMMEPRSHSYGAAAEVIHKIQKAHQRKGWADIGYHFIIDRSGRIWEGRELKYQGAHAGGKANRGNIGIVLMGDFTQQRVTSAQAKSLKNFLSHLCKKYRLPPKRVYTHGEIVNAKTECPGWDLTRFIIKFRQDKLALIGR